MIIESLREDPALKVHLTCKSIIEKQRAETDGKMAIDLDAILGTIDFWICITPFDAEIDFRNETEENIEYISV